MEISRSTFAFFAKQLIQNFASDLPQRSYDRYVPYSHSAAERLVFSPPVYANGDVYFRRSRVRCIETKSIKAETDLHRAERDAFRGILLELYVSGKERGMISCNGNNPRRIRNDSALWYKFYVYFFFFFITFEKPQPHADRIDFVSIPNIATSTPRRSS